MIITVIIATNIRASQKWGAFLFVLLFAIVKDWKISNDQLLTTGKNCRLTVVNDGIFSEMCAFCEGKIADNLQREKRYNEVTERRKEEGRRSNCPNRRRKVGKLKAADGAPTM